MTARTHPILCTLAALAMAHFAIAAAAEVAATSGAAAVPDPVPVEEVLVTGQQPGPGLWKVTRPGGEGGNVLWILGTHGPLPKKLEWRSRELESALAASQEVIAPVAMDAKVGPLGGITLLPSLIGIRDNPDDLALVDVVPADLYARWLPLKERYIGRDRDVEGWRPIFAAQKLYESALRKSGLERSGVVWPAVEKLARKSKVRITEPEVEVKVDKPRAAIKEFKQTPLDDLQCFAKTIERLESDLDLMRERANAWAMGDVPRVAVHAGARCRAMAGASRCGVGGGGGARSRGEFLDGRRAVHRPDPEIRRLRQSAAREGLRRRGSLTASRAGCYGASPGH